MPGLPFDDEEEVACESDCPKRDLEKPVPVDIEIEGLPILTLTAADAPPPAEKEPKGVSWLNESPKEKLCRHKACVSALLQTES